jgi:hypothetical protein
MADEGSTLDPKPVHQRTDVGGHAALIVAGGRLVRVAVAAEVGDDQTIVLGERRDLLAPGEPGLGEAVQQQNRRAMASLHIVLLQAVGFDGVMGEEDRHDASSDADGRTNAPDASEVWRRQAPT